METRENKFFLDGKEITLLSGAVHYFRIVPEYWRDRLQRVKACGLNCVETYVPWNLHEEIKGEFNFEGILNLREFIKIAQEVGLYVIFRPGPYICSEWDFGGLPSWLLADPKMQVRSSYGPYLDAISSYFSKLLPLVTDLQFTKGGPIIMVQIENEYGSYGDDMKYCEFLKQEMTKQGIVEKYFTSDNGAGIQVGQIPGVLMTANLQEKDQAYLMFEYMKNVKQPGQPLMVMEFWSGWFDHWGDNRHTWPVEKLEYLLNYVLDYKSSVNFYMFHGGTNFGFMNGANEGLGATNDGRKVEPYCPDITSYDYDAPVSENGDLTEKYFKIREIIAKRFPEQVPKELPEPPKNIPSTAYGEAKVVSHLKFEHILSHVKAIKSMDVKPMEFLDINNKGGQGYGMILYRSTIGSGQRLHFKQMIHDRAVVYVNGKQEASIDWIPEDPAVDINTKSDNNKLDILVENCGRVNYAEFKSDVLNNQRKGLTSPLYVDNKMIRDFEIFPLEFKKDFMKELSQSKDWQDGIAGVNSPSLHKVILTLKEPPTDTFLSMKGWTKGFVYVNGFNLGRYWNRGPQDTLYVPGPLLKQGDNEFLIFELHQTKETITFVDKASLGEPIIHSVILPMSVRMMIFSLKSILSLGSWTWSGIKLFMK